uniref:Uncharacterized protein n=1 Tax=Anguilla anguilla TaxID=7936 RepID=A0A0E9VKF1_ANGAN
MEVLSVTEPGFFSLFPEKTLRCTYFLSPTTQHGRHWLQQWSDLGGIPFSA